MKRSRLAHTPLWFLQQQLNTGTLHTLQKELLLYLAWCVYQLPHCKNGQGMLPLLETLKLSYGICQEQLNDKRFSSSHTPLHHGS